MHLSLTNISVTFPIFDVKQRSFKKTLLHAATGGKLGSLKNGVTTVQALKNISLEAKEGERLALIGHNGSGKTTLLRVLAGVYYPTKGKIAVQGKITSLLDTMLGMDGESTGLENIRMRGLLLGIHPKKRAAIVDEIIVFSELGEFINLPVRTYSSGMVLRLAFAITTCVQPEILLMDEWISVGDEDFRKKAEKRLMKFIDSAGILVLATHDHELAKRLCSRRVYLQHGKITSGTS